MATLCKAYDFSQIEPHWQAFWAKDKTFQAINFDERPPYYILDMFPYPSGAGLHIGHPEGYTATDILGRYKKACGYNVLHPMGWDAFGLPAEQHAIATGTPPAENTAANINIFRGQIQRLGFGLDWDREVNTTDPQYYRWTQWIFLKLFQKGLAYVDEKPIWWCPALGTALSNEEIVNGLSERGNHPVERKNLRQWVLRITAYADKLLENLTGLDWPDSTKRQQIAWIGRSEGADISFDIEGHPGRKLTAYTTRIDTVYGTSFIVMAPEHPYVREIAAEDCLNGIEAYIDEVKVKSDLMRTDLAKDKSGVFTGAYAINPINGARIPIWVADYVLMSYGTGIVIGVPGHDERDYEFATHYKLPTPQVLKKPEDATADGSQTPMPYLKGQGNDEGVLVNSGKYNGLTSKAAIKALTEALAATGHGQASVQYKLRDWLFSRQRYWGEPFPVIWITEADFKKLEAYPNSPFHEFMPKEPVRFEKDGHMMVALPLADSMLPLLLPHVEKYQPAGTGESPLALATDWLNVVVNLKTGEVKPREAGLADAEWIEGSHETNTMPNWAGSCWYYLRYLDPKNKTALVDPEIERYWGAPAYYVGGAEHAVLHLLYARFWHRFMYEEGIVSQPEPFPRLFHQGIILGEDGTKMSKSKGNTVNPDDIIKENGADALRLYEMFLGPLEDMKPWNPQGIEGVCRFLRRSFREVLGAEGTGSGKVTQGDNADSPALLRVLNQTIKKVTEDIEGLRFNTAISQLMVCLNQLQEETSYSQRSISSFVQMIAPFAPHLAEELWERIGNPPSVCNAKWPTWDALYLIETSVSIAVQINGRVRGHLETTPEITEDAILQLAQANTELKLFFAGKNIKKAIYVPGKILNFVLEG